MNVAPPTIESLAPLFQGSTASDAQVWQCLARHLAFIQRVLRTRIGPGVEQDDLQAAVVERLFNKVTRGPQRGIPPAKGSPSAYLATIVKNAALDEIRKRQQPDRPRRVVAEKPRTRPAPEDWYARLTDRERAAVERTLEAQGNYGVSPVLVLAWVAQFLPQRLSPEQVREAVDYTPTAGSSHEIGLARDADRTWFFLQDWCTRHHDDPRHRDATLELAWILRCTRTSTPEVWKAAHEAEVAKARDTIRQWRNRAAKDLALPGHNRRKQ